MAGIADTDAFYAVVRSQIEPLLGSVLPLPLGHWMILVDERGTPTVCALDEDTEPMAVEEVLASHMDRGEAAAAFVTARETFVMAQVLVASPRNSDTRRAEITEGPKGLVIGPWFSVY